MEAGTAPYKQKWIRTAASYLAVLFALIPSALTLIGMWFSDTIWFFINFYYVAAGVCFAVVLALIWVVQPELPGALVSENFPTGGQIGPVGVGKYIPRWIANSCIALSAAAFLFFLSVAAVTQRPPGPELLVLALLYWLGWGLREGLLENVLETWRRHRHWVPAYLLFCLAFLAGLVVSERTLHFPWYAWLLVVFLGIPLWRRRRAVPFPAWAFLGGWLLYSYRLGHWLYAVVGDEYSFYNAAREILAMRPEDFSARFFDCCLVYGMHPFISSLLQSAWMVVFGTANFGWRGLNPFLCALALPCYFYFFRAFTSRAVAMAAVVMLAGSSYLMDFVKIGYNNPQAFWGLGLLLAACVWALRKPGGASYTGLGLAAALCLYLYPPALYALPVAGLVMLFYAPPLSRRRWLHWGLAGGLFLLFASLLLFFPTVVPMRLIGTYAWSEELRSSENLLFLHTIKNFGLALLSGYLAPVESHFVVASYQDPLSAALSLLGLAFVVTRLRRGSLRFSAFLLLAFVLLLYLVGASHDRSTPSTTRMFLMLPWFSLFAALGLEWLVVWAKSAHGMRIALLSAILMLNVIQAYGLALIRDNDNQTLEVLFIRLAQDLERKAPQPGRGYIFVTAEDHGIDGFYLFQDIYPQFLANARLGSVFVDQAGYNWIRDLKRDARNLIIETEFLDMYESAAAREALASAGWSVCSQKTVDGVARFNIWYAPDPRYPAGPCSPVRQPIRPELVWQVGVGLAVLIDLLVIGWVRWRRHKGRSIGLAKLDIAHFINRRMPGLPLDHLRFQPFRTLWRRISPGLALAFSALLVVAWALWTGRELLNFSTSFMPWGSDFSLAVRENYFWPNLLRCGTCALWNGNYDGGYPALLDLLAAPLHPLVALPALAFGIVNGAKLTVVLSLGLAGLAQLWIGRILGLSRAASTWGALLAVVAGSITGRMEIGQVTLVVSTATGALWIAAILQLEKARTYRNVILLALVSGLLALSGQGYIQIAVALAILPAAILLFLTTGLKPGDWFRKILAAGVLGFLSAAVLVVPLLNNLALYSKATDLGYTFNFPLHFQLFNLIYPDIPRDLFDKGWGAVYHFHNYLGIIPVALALLIPLLAPRKKLRLLLFFLVALVLIYLCSSLILPRLLFNWINPDFAAGIRHPAVMAGLAGPLVLALASWSVDRLLCFFGVSPDRFVKAVGRLTTVGLMLISLLMLYSSSSRWLTLQRYDAEISFVRQLKPSSVVWVDLSNENYWNILAPEQGLKLTRTFHPWEFRGVEPPPAMVVVSREIPLPSSEVPYEVFQGLYITRSPEYDYASVSTGKAVYICEAESNAGWIDVLCDNPTPGTLTVLEHAWSGWSVSIDGVPAALSPSPWLSVNLPGGTHRIEFRYRPWDVPLGLGISLVTLLLMGFLWKRHPVESLQF